jgi:acyl-CoA synthetase (AMP-forming)/AMP-acid ligase II
MNILLDRIDRAPADSPAVADDEVRLSYGELRDWAMRVAGVMAAEHGEGRYIIVRASSTAAFIATFVGVMYSGNTPIPIDPELPEVGVAYIREKSRAAAVLDPLEESVYHHAAAVSRPSTSIPALVMFTSGTTGFPKGVIVSSENLRHACAAIAQYLEYPKYPSAAVALPLHYSYALLSQVCCMLSVGGRIRLFRDLRNPLQLNRVVNEEALQTFCGVPSTYHALALFHQLRSLRMESVRVLCSAGAAMDRGKYETAKTIFPSAAFYNNYGMTEAAPRLAWIRDDDARFAEPTCGRPMDGVDMKIVDTETGCDLSDGQPGMLVVKGPNITAGYLNDPEATVRAFTADGYLISGDIAHRDRGYFFISGRVDDIFNCGGEKISPLEIERALNAISGVEASAVAGLPDGGRGKVPVAFLKLCDPVYKKDLVRELAARLTSNKIPQRYLEVRAFPTTSNGKIQRRLLSTDDARYVVGEIR